MYRRLPNLVEVNHLSYLLFIRSFYTQVKFYHIFIIFDIFGKYENKNLR